MRCGCLLRRPASLLCRPVCRAAYCRKQPRTAASSRASLQAATRRHHPPCRRGATPRDFRVLPRRIFLVRHAESEGNVDNIAYTYLPDPRVPLTARGWQQVG